MNTAEILEKAASIIEERGLNQDGHYYNHHEWRESDKEPRDCKLCTVGALLVAAGHDPLTTHVDGVFRDAEALVIAELRLRGVDEYIAAWSDDLDSPSDAIDILRTAAVMA